MTHHTPSNGPGLLDLHLHSTCSADGASSIAEYARRAVELGLAELGFCEHVDLDPRDRGCNYLDPVHYAREIAAAREEIAAPAQLADPMMPPSVRLRQGVEVTYQASRADEARAWLAGGDWDYVVISVHLVDYADGWATVSEPGAMGAYFATHSQRQAYAPYFEELLRAAQSGLGDVLGHLDLVKRYGAGRYGPFEPAAFEEEIRAVLHAAIQSGMGLEINTSGLRQSPGEPYPASPVLRWYQEMGGEILTTGSDAHHTSDLGAGIAEALDLARSIGFRAIATFDRRQVRWMDL
jgi:histidinol-phosphatase (PHP family)